jgi:Ca-activated chloride channel family protein
MAAIDDFLKKREGDAFGLTFFGHNVLHWTPLTTDASAIRCSPPFMRPESLPPWFGGTAIGKALRACKAVLVTRQEGDRMVILVTDGISSDMHGGEAAEIANDLKQNNIAVYAIHVGGGEAPTPMVEVTSMTGGEVFAPEDQASLQAVFARIDQMKEAKLEKTLGETIDNFTPFCLAGLSLVGLCTLALFGLRYTPW